MTQLAAPVPFEALKFGLGATMAALAPCRLRLVTDSPDGGAIADYLGDELDPLTLAARLDENPGVVSHGLFPPAMVSDLIIGRSSDVEHRTGSFGAQTADR